MKYIAVMVVHTFFRRIGTVTINNHMIGTYLRIILNVSWNINSIIIKIDLDTKLWCLSCYILSTYGFMFIYIL